MKKRKFDQVAQNHRIGNSGKPTCLLLTFVWLQSLLLESFSPQHDVATPTAIKLFLPSTTQLRDQLVLVGLYRFQYWKFPHTRLPVMVTMVGRILAPKWYSNPGILIPGTYKYATCHGKKDFTNVRKVRILRGKDYPWLFYLITWVLPQNQRNFHSYGQKKIWLQDTSYRKIALLALKSEQGDL